MKIPSRKALLSELDSFGHGARMRRAATLGRDARGQPALSALMTELLAGDAYEANLALQMARGAREGDLIQRALTHPSASIRGHAASLAGTFVLEDAALEEVLPRLAPFARRRILQGVARAHRSPLALRLLPGVLARHGAHEAALLLSSVGAEAVRRLLPELEHAVSNWRTLALRYPDEVLDFLRSRLAQLPERARGAFFARFHAPLVHLTLHRAEATLALARDFASPEALPRFVTEASRRLTRHHPEPFTQLLLRPSWRATLLSQGLPSGMLRATSALPQASRLALARALAEAPAHLTPFLDSLPPSERAALFTHAFAETPPRLLPDALLAVLPHATRDAEAARQLELREVKEDRDRQLELQALRTIEHAREPLLKAAFASKAEHRAQALVLLVKSTGLSRRGLTETLASLARLKNEQDPVRSEVLSALARVPPTLFAPEHLPALQAQVTFVVEARDTSYGTRWAVQELAFRLLRLHAATPEHPLFRFALETLKQLAGQSGSLSLPPLEHSLPRGAEHHLVAALLPMIRAANARESPALIFSLTGALGRRAWNVEMLQALLEPLTTSTPDTIAQQAIHLWLAAPRTRDTRVRKLLDRDESTLTLAPLHEHLHLRRQEWLDPFIHGRVLRGRFSTGKTGWVFPASTGFHRWLPRQQRTLSELLWRIVRDTARNAWERTSTIQRLARMPVTTADDLSPLLESPEVPIVEAALGALAWVDVPESGLPRLLERVDGELARVAMYAVERVARRSAPEAFSHVLDGLLSREKLKVTVHKEALRLLATFRSPRSMALLRQQWERPSLHRDVRIAVGHAARRLLDEPAAWELLDAMARSPDEYVAASLLDQAPTQLPLEQRPRYTTLLLQVSRHPELSIRQRTFTTLPVWSPGMEAPIAREAARRVLDLVAGAEWREALGALVAVAPEEQALGEVLACASGLLSAPPTPDATPERDVPARQRLRALCDALLGWPRAVRVRLRPRLDDVARLLSREASLWPQGAALRLAGLEWTAAPRAAEVLLALEAETREEPLFAPALAAAVGSALAPLGAEWTPETLLELSDAVASGLPLVAVTLVALAGERLHWREDAARRLRTLRQHPRPAVRAAAYTVLTARE